MRITIVFALLTSLVCCSTAQNYPPLDFDSSESDTSSSTALGSIGIHFAKQLLSSDLIQNKLQTVFDLADLKLRMVTIIKSLFTQENLLQARRIIDFLSEVSSFIGKFLPELPKNEGTGSKINMFSLLFNSGSTNNHRDEDNEISLVPTQKPPTRYGPPSTMTTKQFFIEPEVSMKRSADLPEGDTEVNNYRDDIHDLTN